MINAEIFLASDLIQISIDWISQISQNMGPSAMWTLSGDILCSYALMSPNVNYHFSFLCLTMILFGFLISWLKLSRFNLLWSFLKVFECHCFCCSCFVLSLLLYMGTCIVFHCIQINSCCIYYLSSLE